MILDQKTIEAHFDTLDKAFKSGYVPFPAPPECRFALREKRFPVAAREIPNMSIRARVYSFIEYRFREVAKDVHVRVAYYEENYE